MRARELEVLGPVAAGLPNRTVAERFQVSWNIVRHHLQSILYRLNVHSKLEASAAAVREGLAAREAPTAG